MPLSRKVQQALNEANAKLVRENKHYVYKLPNGAVLTMSKTASCPFAERHQLADLNRALKKPLDNARVSC